MKYLIVIEETETGFSAYSPDRPGCASTGKTLEETERNMHEAIEFHIEGLRAGYEVPRNIGVRIEWHLLKAGVPFFPSFRRRPESMNSPQRRVLDYSLRSPFGRSTRYAR